jgi:phosphotransferase system HPr (HPr) family protein
LSESEFKICVAFDGSSAAQLVQTASRFKSHISLVVGDKVANAKSIMGIISLGLQCGDIIKVVASGEDEQMVFDELNFLGEMS